MSFLDSLAATLQKFVTPVNVTFMLKAAGISVAIALAALSFGTVLGVLGQQAVSRRISWSTGWPPSM